jgi:transcriptional regulator with XRE-family HTH domain
MHMCIMSNTMQGVRKSAIDWNAVGRRVRELRGFEIAQAEFARELGISQGQLSRYEKGRSEIGAEVLLRLARRSGRTVEWLLTGRDGA